MKDELKRLRKAAHDIAWRDDLTYIEAKAKMENLVSEILRIGWDAGARAEREAAVEWCREADDAWISAEAFAARRLPEFPA